MRVGIFGGTFDPPHLGHLIPVEVAAAEFRLDHVYFVPAYVPPHKRHDDLTDGYHRAAMLALALQRYPKFILSTQELLKADVVFTVETVEDFKRSLSREDQLYLLMGTDSFLELQSWRAYDRLIQLCELIMINRGTREEELRESLKQLETILHLDLSKTVHFCRTPQIPVSATRIRHAIREGKSVSTMLLPEVETYIHKHSLYQRR